MPEISTETEFRDLYVPKTSVSISSTEILQAQNTAETVERTLVGDSAVNDAKLESPTNPVRAAAIKAAHFKLTKRELLGTRGTRFSDYGINKSTRDSNGQLTNSYADYSEIQKERADLLAEAREILEAYLTTETVEETTITQARSRVVPVSIVW